MRSVIAAISVFAALAAGTAASARMTDAQFLEANRCRALIASQDLGAQDTQAADRKLHEEAAGRDPAVSDMAESARERAQREARRPNDVVKARLLAERDGACRTLLQ
jgi:hypothetical protein